MSVPIGFDAASGSIVIMGNRAFPARTLTASVSDELPGRIQIDDIAGRGEQMVLWSDVTSLDGSYTPVSTADALAYLAGEFAKGAQFQAIPAPYPLMGAATFAINHGLSYVPSTTVLDVNGFEVDADVAHAPGQTVLTFASPFTGTLYLG